MLQRTTKEITIYRKLRINRKYVGILVYYSVCPFFFLDKKLKFCYNYMESIMQFAVFILGGVRS